ncbi:carboxypeptidase regulatory-like domain-containing protein, partial [Candidatus Woesebacteria bacterium]|nr:carboxypeptidase regulatory-like domain-containing protein [Candidatus Woesebacteria bacterium]
VTDSHGLGIENAIIRVTDEVTGQTRVLLRTDENGQFATRITAGVYQLAVSKLGYVWVEDNQAVSYREAVATRNSAPLAITLKPIQEVLIPV